MIKWLITRCSQWFWWQTKLTEFVIYWHHVYSLLNKLPGLVIIYNFFTEYIYIYIYTFYFTWNKIKKHFIHHHVFNFDQLYIMADFARYLHIYIYIQISASAFIEHGMSVVSVQQSILVINSWCSTHCTSRTDYIRCPWCACCCGDRLQLRFIIVTFVHPKTFVMTSLSNQSIERGL